MIKDYQTLFCELSALGEVGQATADFIRRRKVRIGFRNQSPVTGAYWWIDGNIYINPSDYPPGTRLNHPGLLSVIVHETCHLRQGVWTALSVYGEMEAWQVGFRAYQRLTGRNLHPVLTELLKLPLGWDREVLQAAQVLMQKYAGKKYRIGWLPLYPLPREIQHRLFRRK